MSLIDQFAKRQIYHVRTTGLSGPEIEDKLKEMSKLFTRREGLPRIFLTLGDKKRRSFVEEIEGRYVFHIELGHISEDKREGIIKRMEEDYKKEYKDSCPETNDDVFFPMINGVPEIIMEYVS